MLIKWRFLIIFTLSQITVATFLGRHLIINRCHRRHLPTLKNNFFSLICQISSFFCVRGQISRFFGLKFFFRLTESWSFFLTSPRMDETLALTKSNCKLPFPRLKRYKKILGKGLIDKWIRESFSRLCSSQKNSLKITIKSLIISQ